MKELLKPYYLRVKDLLLKAKSDDMDLEEIRFEVDRLQHEFFNVTEKNYNPDDLKIEGEDAVWGLFEKFEQFYGERAQLYHNRDEESGLSINLDWGLGGFQPQHLNAEVDLSSIQKEITTYITQRVKTPKDEFEQPLLTGVVNKQITSDQMIFLVNKLTELSHSFTEHVYFFDRGNWNWKKDCVFIAQYVFEKVAELTYKVDSKEQNEVWNPDIRDSFSYYEIGLSEELQEKIDGEFCKLQEILIDIISFVERNKYHELDKDTWYRPIIFNIGFCGMLYTLENV